MLIKPSYHTKEEVATQRCPDILSLLSPAAYLRKVEADQVELRANLRQFQPNLSLRDSQRDITLGAGRTTSTHRYANQAKDRKIRDARDRHAIRSFKSR